MHFKWLLTLWLFLFSILGFSQGNSCKEDLLPRRGENRLYGYSDLFGNWKVIPFYTRVFPFRGSVAVVQKGLKYGVINCDGKVVLRPIYDEINEFVNGYAWLKKDDKWGLINEKGMFLLDPVYEEVKDISRFNDYAWVKKNAEWGVFSKDLQSFIHEPQFSNYKLLSDSFSLVQDINEKLGMIKHSRSEIIFDLVYDQVAKVGPYRLAIRKGDKWGLISEFGKELIAPTYDTIVQKYKNRLEVQLDKKSGMINYQGRIITPVIYDQMLNYNSGGIGVIKSGKYGFLNYLGREAIPCEYDSSSSFRGKYAIVKKNTNWFLLSKLNKRVSDNYLDVRIIREGYVVKSDSGWGMLNRKGELVIDPKYDFFYWKDPSHIKRATIDTKMKLIDVHSSIEIVGEWENMTAIFQGVSIVTASSKKGVVDTTGKFIVPLKYDAIQQKYYNQSNWFVVTSMTKKGLYRDNRQVLEAKYKAIQLLPKDKLLVNDGAAFILMTNNGRIHDTGFTSFQLTGPEGIQWPAIVEKKGKIGLVNANGVMKVPLKYDDITWIGATYFRVRKGKKVGVVNSNGKEILSMNFQEVGKFSERFFSVKQDDKWGYMDARQKLMIAYQFEEVSSFKDGGACVVKNGNQIMINKKGKKVSDCEK